MAYGRRACAAGFSWGDYREGVGCARCGGPFESAPEDTPRPHDLGQAPSSSGGPDGRASVPSQAHSILFAMDDLNALVGSARDLAGAVMRKASDQLLVDADVGCIHKDFVVVAIEMLEEVEIQALRAATGDRYALHRIADLVDSLAKLLAKLDEQ